jgi:YVTN family beta-propeller protein
MFKRLLNNRVYLLWLLVGLLVSSCGGEAADESLSAEDFLQPAGSEEDHDHDDHDHDEEPEEPVFDPSLTETEEEGVFIDHHGNRIVDELYQKYEDDDVKLEFTVENFLGVGGRGGEVSADIRAGERAVVKFKVSDATTESPIEGIRPLVWMDRLPSEELDLAAGDGGCQDKVEGYLSGTLTARPTLDLNSFFILALNNDPSISVIDPTVDVGGMTQLFALIQLNQPGEDWAMSADQEELWVTLPGTNQVAIAELDGFSLAQHLDGGPNPQRIAFQPDQRYLWIGNDAENRRESGVSVIDPETRQMVAQIVTGAGHHELAFSPDSRYAYVTNSEEGRLSIIDTEMLEVVEEVRTGQEPVAVAVSESSGAIYAGDRRSGHILVLDGQSFEEIAELEGDRGLGALAIAPGGRWGIATNPEEGQVILFDTSSHEVTHVAEIDGAPDQIAFSQDVAYIRAREAAQIVTIPLAEIDPAAALPVNMVPVGEQAPGFFPSMSLANAVFPIPDQGATVVANPADDQVYFYPEGATAASGSFQGHTLFPRAAQVVDRSLREEAPGVYAGRVRIPEEGEYLVAVMLSDPLLVHCFEFTAKPNEALQAAANLPELVHLNDNLNPVAGEPFALRFQLTDPDSGQGIEGLEDVFILANQIAGNWSSRSIATSLGDGVYEVELTIPNAGLYSVFFAVPSIGLNIDQSPSLSLQVTAGS